MHLTSKFFFAKTNLIVIWNTSAKKVLDSVKSSNFCAPTKSRNYTRTPPFCFTTEFKETGSSGSCDVYPGRLNISGPLISFTMVQYTFEKCAKTPSRSAISCCSNIPDLKRGILNNLLAIIGQWYNKDVNDGFILSNRNKRGESVRTIEELSLELLPQTSKSYFQNFLLDANQQFATDNLYLPIPQNL